MSSSFQTGKSALTNQNVCKVEKFLKCTKKIVSTLTTYNDINLLNPIFLFLVITKILLKIILRIYDSYSIMNNIYI